jgi:hypothetical protein
VVYNTQREPIAISEHGRIAQEYIKLIMAEDDRIRRNYMAKQLIKTLTMIDPEIKKLDDYEHKLWDHLYMISDYQLDVDSPYPMPDRETVNRKPDPVEYKDVRIRFRFYGRNLQKMVESAEKMPEGDAKEKFINQIASFMVNSSRNWNDENLDNQVVANHIKTLSNNDLEVNPDNLEIHLESRRKTTNNNNRKKKSKKNRNRRN